MADGPVIQRASERALKQACRCAMCWTWWPSFVTGCDTPVVLMGYGNPVEAMGLERLRSAGLLAWTVF